MRDYKKDDLWKKVVQINKTVSLLLQLNEDYLGALRDKYEDFPECPDFVKQSSKKNKKKDRVSRDEVEAILVPGNQVPKLDVIIEDYHLDVLISDENLRKNCASVIAMNEFLNYIHNMFNLFGFLDSNLYKERIITNLSVIEILITDMLVTLKDSGNHEAIDMDFTYGKDDVRLFDENTGKCNKEFGFCSKLHLCKEYDFLPGFDEEDYSHLHSLRIKRNGIHITKITDSLYDNDDYTADEYLNSAVYLQKVTDAVCELYEKYNLNQ